MKKNILLTIASMGLVAALSIGGTLAYLTAKTDEKTNVFTGEDEKLKGHIEEEDWKYDKEGYTYLPGDVVAKDPMLVNDSDLSAYAALKVEFVVDGNKVSYDEFTNYATVSYNKVDGFNTEDFDVTVGNDEVFLVCKEAIEKKGKTPDIFDQVHVNYYIKQVLSKEYSGKDIYYYDENNKLVKVENLTTGVDENITYYDSEGNEMNLEGSLVLPKFDIVITGFMVQEKNTTFEDATTQLKELAGVK